ncbi:MAG: TonB-dependent receptor [Calditrichaeota bacterium]|nr:TonB-dependent receptor [Calditrichota bacterium]
MNRIVLILIILFFNSTLSAQTILKGYITDENNQDIAAANIYLKGTVLGASSAADGRFQINMVPAGDFTLVISMIGFNEKELPVSVKNEKDIDLGTITLSSSPLPTQPIVTTASKYEQNVQDVVSSISNVSAQEIERRNNISLKGALKYVSGISLNDDQINIRGSSGYSRGVGSRVLLMVDGVPYVTGDTQGAEFEAMTMNEVANIEIVKGSGSALYGSGAVGGVVNIITKPVSDEQQIKLKVYGGLYDDPYYPDWKWSSTNRYVNGQQVGYSNKWDNLGMRFSLARDEDDSYRKNDVSKRVNFGGKINYEFSPFDRLTLSGNYMEQKKENFLYWKNLENALVPPDDQLGDRVHSKRAYLSSAYRSILSNEKYYTVNAIWFHNYFDDFVGGEAHDSKSDFFNMEWQYNAEWEKHFFTFGVNPSMSSVASNLFGTHEGINAAVFVQDEIKWSQQFSATLGLRYDYSDIDRLGQDQQLNPKLGLVWKYLTGGAIRLSAGTGFRAPSIAEAFTSTSAGGLIVVPNTKLDAEKSVSLEIGLNQIFSEYLALDIALFNNNYQDLIEGRLLESGNIQFQNITKARIRGAEINFFGRIANNNLTYRAGYTYVDPRDLSSDTFLTYRPRHLLYANTSLSWRFLTLSTDYRFMSRYDKIDNTFTLVIEDARKRVDAHILDLRLTADLNLFELPFTATMHINNLLQYNYVDLVGSIAPIRQVVLTLETEL